MRSTSEVKAERFTWDYSKSIAIRTIHRSIADKAEVAKMRRLIFRFIFFGSGEGIGDTIHKVKHRVIRRRIVATNDP